MVSSGAYSRSIYIVNIVIFFTNVLAPIDVLMEYVPFPVVKNVPTIVDQVFTAVDETHGTSDANHN
jgi:hypothetical protein